MKHITLEEISAYLMDLNKRMTWKEIAVLPDFYGIPPGTLYAIAHGRDPKSPIIRDQLGLPQEDSCGQCWRFNQYIGLARRLRRKPSRLHQMSKQALKLAFRNREVVQDG